MKKNQTIYWVLGAGALAGLGYWYFKRSSLNLQGHAPTPAPAPAPSLQSGIPSALPSGAGITRPVVLTNALSANDLYSGLIHIFKAGETVNVWGAPVAGFTTLSDNQQPPHVYTTSSVVAGVLR